MDWLRRVLYVGGDADTVGAVAGWVFFVDWSKTSAIHGMTLGEKTQNDDISHLEAERSIDLY